LPVFTIRPLAEREPGELLEILGVAFGDLYNQTDTKIVLSSPGFNSADCFIAEQDGSAIGSVAVTSLTRSFWFVIRYLAVTSREDRLEIARALVQKALEHARAKGAVSIRATTPAVDPYVQVYREFGFAPVRKDFRITWELDEARQMIVELPLRVLEVSENNVAEAADLFVRALTPLWDWRTEENGGPEAEGCIVSEWIETR
jgi:predicted N-acetyltransferase YhbS